MKEKSIEQIQVEYLTSQQLLRLPVDDAGKLSKLEKNKETSTSLSSLTIFDTIKKKVRGC